jgi:hypothetical protein
MSNGNKQQAKKDTPTFLQYFLLSKPLLRLFDERLMIHNGCSKGKLISKADMKVFI